MNEGQLKDISLKLFEIRRVLDDLSDEIYNIEIEIDDEVF